MALGSLSIDNLLPAFEPIRRASRFPTRTEMQLVLTAYMAGLRGDADRLGSAVRFVGRRPILMVGPGASIPPARCRHLRPELRGPARRAHRLGFGRGCGRVLAVTIVRDRFEGRDMARVMSLTSS